MTAVIRAWDSRHNPVGYAVAEFQTKAGAFELSGDHPLVKLVEHNEAAISFFTILSTEELQWRLINMRHVGDPVEYNVRFVSRPWISELRRELVSDQWFVENVIEPAGGTVVEP
ncbi:hypothetical protein CH249_01980 [Rhodococcus sp. 05-2255-3B1]|uniref:hypothetical protein n=1 Tax=unclassified Rhodococcus (in: high G+C Gram-positive bacteria) TaxID=192944 RepID=UPI000B9BE65D|nr:MULTISPECIES: hypothetical protein [unclassified Rhodococcus (in: high G+C Gram-positive bacteria)]OZE13348.1 hypothetical protein CH250_05385 [Rhodococcus sp. 05-2255-3C]OZE16040.1 hypothetical protein CH249_01980 [Rhodococcus sp. 05-2255-3B1]OZE19080.1 hypothetical protein CH255_14005 [Rhodococcus sp. 05-2255-2A2]